MDGVIQIIETRFSLIEHYECLLELQSSHGALIRHCYRRVLEKRIGILEKQERHKLDKQLN